MTHLPEKRDYPVSRVRRYLEPGPVVLVSSARRGETNIMALGWHTVLEFTPSLVGLMIRDSGECVINLPTAGLADAVVGIGNCSGRAIDCSALFRPEML